jgi:serine/threonine protein kinase
MSSLDDSLR